jgi:hypothetical protein
MTVDYWSLLQRAASTIAGHVDGLVRGEGVSRRIAQRTPRTSDRAFGFGPELVAQTNAD